MTPRLSGQPVSFLDLYRNNRRFEPEFFRQLRNLYRQSSFVGGPWLEKFEDDFARFAESPYCVGVSSGTAALHLALIAAGVGRNDEVILPAFTFPGTVWGILYQGAIPVFADVRLEDGCLDPEDVARKTGPKTKAIIAVHLFGHPAPMDELRKICGRKIALVEDAAQAHGGSYRGKALGSLGNFGCFSFYPTKNLGGIGDGGAIVTEKKSLADRLRQLRDHGQAKRFFPEEVGFNARLDAIQALFLSLKLPVLDSDNTRRTEIAGKYLEALKGSKNILPLRPSPRGKSAWHAFVVRSKNRANILRELDKAGIGRQIYYPSALPALKLFRRFAKGRYPAAVELARTVVALPLHAGLTGSGITKIAGFLKSRQKPSSV